MDNILVVEDDITVRDNLSRLLTMEGYNVVTAEDGREALDTITKTKNIDLILSDIKMPNIDGYELLKQLKGNKNTELIPLIFLSAKTSQDEVRRGMNIGAEDYITKPFSAEDILNTIKTRLEKLKAHRSVVNDLKNNIIKNLPHELRTPLVSILGYSDLMLSDLNSLSDKELKEMIELIKRSGLRLSGWIEKFVQFCEIEAELENSKISPKNIADICSTEDFNWQENFFTNKEWMDRKEEIKIDLEPANLQICRLHVEFLIRELVENAAKFSKPGTKIEVKGTKNNSYYRIDVLDHGDGFRESEIQSIGPFNQFDRFEKQQNGNGLGLSIINRMVMLNNGDMKIKSTKNEFTIVTILIPLAKSNY